jgi:hypothetical protein
MKNPKVLRNAQLEGLNRRVNEALSKPRTEAIKELGNIASDVLEYSFGKHDVDRTEPIRIITVSGLEGDVNPTVPNFFNNLLSRMKKNESFSDAVNAMTNDDILSSWKTAEENVKRGVGQSITPDRLQTWGEVADTLAKRGLKDIAKELERSRANLDRYMGGQMGIGFCCPAENWTLEQSLEIFLHEGHHVKTFRDSCHNTKLLEELQLSSPESIRGHSDFLRLREIPGIAENYFGRLSNKVVGNISSELIEEGRLSEDDANSLFAITGKPLVPFNNATLTGEGLGSYMGRKMMRDIGFEPQFRYNDPVYSLGIKMWESVMEHAQEQGVDAENVTGILGTPYSKKEGELPIIGSKSLIGVVELFENRKRLIPFLNQNQ